MNAAPQTRASKTLVALAIATACGSQAIASEGQFYAGISGGLSQLEPATGETGYTIDDDQDGAFTLFGGYDLTDYLSVEGYYGYLGKATLSGPTNWDGTSGVSGLGSDTQFLGDDADTTTGTVAYSALGASAIVQFPHNGPGLSGLVKLGMSYLTSSTETLTFDQADKTSFSAGLGVEYQLANGVAFRGMYDYMNEHVQTLNLSVLKRLGKTTASVAEPAAAATVAPAIAAAAQQQAAAEKAAAARAQQEAAAKAKAAADAKARAAAAEQARQQAQQQRVVVQAPQPAQVVMQAPAVVMAPSYNGPTFTDADLDGVADGVDACPDTRVGNSVDARGCAAGDFASSAIVSQGYSGTPQGRVLDGVTFVSGSAALTPAGKSALQALAPEIAGSASRIALVGHTDNVGDPARNLALSEQRAKTVAEYLAGLGIAAERLQFGGKGEEIPLVSNATAEGRARNRRVEMFID